MRSRSNSVAALLTCGGLAAAVVLGGCGGGDAAAPGSSSGPSINERSATQAQAEDAGRKELVATLRDKLSLRAHAGEPDAFRVSSGWCTVSVHLDSPQMVKLYADAGDPMATNPSETLGVKVERFEGVDSAECVDAAVRALADL
jgi:hypothetical protein